MARSSWIVAAIACLIIADCTTDTLGDYFATLPLEVDSDTARTHLLTPPYVPKAPPNIRVVVLSAMVTTDARGNVVAADYSPSSTFPDQPVELVREFMRRTEQSRYRPFIKDGQPIAAKFRVSASSDLSELEQPPKLAHVPFPAPKDRQSIHIALKRSVCAIGTCPEYQIDIDGDGTVHYNGGRFVAVSGAHTSHIPVQAVADLVESFRVTDFFSFNDKYISPVTDAPTYIISIAIDGHLKQIVDYGAPKQISDLEKKVDEIAGSAKWLHGTAETAAMYQAEGLDFYSVQASEILANLATYDGIGGVRAFLQLGTRFTDSFQTRVALSRTGLGKDGDLWTLLVTGGIGNASPELANEALYYSAWRGDLQAATLLIDQGADPNSRFLGSTVLMAAAHSNDPAVVAFVLKHHPDVNALVSGTGQFPFGRGTAISAATYNGLSEWSIADCYKIIKMLIAAGANINLADEYGYTALYQANSADIVRLLVECGADATVRNKNGETPLLATFSELQALAFIEAGADTSARNNKGETILKRAREFHWTKVLQRLGAT